MHCCQRHVDFILNYKHRVIQSCLLVNFIYAVIHVGDNPGILSVIMNLKDRLADIIEPDFGLLDELLRLEVLSRRQYNKVRSGVKAAYERSDAVLDMLTSESQCVNFMKALQRTGQQHVMNFITQNGGKKLNFRSPVFADCSLRTDFSKFDLRPRPTVVASLLKTSVVVNLFHAADPQQMSYV